MAACTEPVVHYEYNDRTGNTIEFKGTCGDWIYMEQRYCDTCYKAKEARYPQGWRAYPGDTCRHGMYTGGSGIDWICGRCEDGIP